MDPKYFMPSVNSEDIGFDENGYTILKEMKSLHQSNTILKSMLEEKTIEIRQLKSNNTKLFHMCGNAFHSNFQVT